MSYTQADLLAVRQAKVALTAGSLIGQVTVMGQVIKYQETTFSAMTEMENQIIKALNQASKTKRRRSVTLHYDRGL